MQKNDGVNVFLMLLLPQQFKEVKGTQVQNSFCASYDGI